MPAGVEQPAALEPAGESGQSDILPQSEEEKRYRNIVQCFAHARIKAPETLESVLRRRPLLPVINSYPKPMVFLHKVLTSNAVFRIGRVLPTDYVVTAFAEPR